MRCKTGPGHDKSRGRAPCGLSSNFCRSGTSSNRFSYCLVSRIPSPGTCPLMAHTRRPRSTERCSLAPLRHWGPNLSGRRPRHLEFASSFGSSCMGDDGRLAVVAAMVCKTRTTVSFVIRRRKRWTTFSLAVRSVGRCGQFASRGCG